VIDPVGASVRLIWARVGSALSLVLLASLVLLSPAPSRAEAAPVSPHSGTSCAQTTPFPFPSKVVGIAATPDDGGYWIVTSGGYVAACGDAPYLGQQTTLNAPIVGIAATPDGRGYYLVASDGGIFSYGDAVFQGSTGGIHLNKPVVGMTVDPATGGYWLVATDGGIFAYNAPFLGSTGAMILNKPVVGMAEADGAGYWLVASDGGIFAYGVPFWGSTGSIHLNQPVVGMAPNAGPGGYWLVASDGGIFAYNALFYGSTGSIVLNHPIVGMEANAKGSGYRFIAEDGGVFSYGSSQFYGTPVFAAPPAPPQPPAPAPAPAPAPTGIHAAFSCTGSAPEGVDITYGTDTSNYAGGMTVPWSTTITLPSNALYAAVDAQLQGPDGSITCNTTVTWPGGSVTQTGNAVGDYNIASAEVCSDYPLDSGWETC
jgi:hypothetical protein